MRLELKNEKYYLIANPKTLVEIDIKTLPIPTLKDGAIYLITENEYKKVYNEFVIKPRGKNDNVQ